MLTRRQLLHLGALGASSAVIGCDAEETDPTTGQGQPVPPAPPPCPDDVALADELVAAFEVDANSALVWTSSAMAHRARVEVSSVDECATRMTDWFELAQAGAARVAGLEAATTYAYRVHFPHGASQWQRLRTAAARDADVDVRFAYSADISVNAQWQTGIADAVVASGAAFYVNLGDWPYADAGEAAHSIDEYRDKHRAVRQTYTSQALLRGLPAYCIYDDHDIRCNWDAKWRDAEPDRIAAGLAAWDEYFPLGRTTRFRSVRRGRHLELYILDTRLYRSANAEEDGPDKTLLGAEQLRWLKESLLLSDATFKLIVSSVPLGYGAGNDSWAGFATERDDLVEFIRDFSVGGVAFLSADRHYFAALHHASGIREFHAGPLAAGPGSMPPDGAELEHLYPGMNFGEVLVHGGDRPTLTVACRDQVGDVRYQTTFEAGELLLR